MSPGYCHCHCLINRKNWCLARWRQTNSLMLLVCVNYAYFFFSVPRSQEEIHCTTSPLHNVVATCQHVTFVRNSDVASIEKKNPSSNRKIDYVTFPVSLLHVTGKETYVSTVHFLLATFRVTISQINKNKRKKIF